MSEIHVGCNGICPIPFRYIPEKKIPVDTVKPVFGGKPESHIEAVSVNQLTGITGIFFFTEYSFKKRGIPDAPKFR